MTMDEQERERREEEAAGPKKKDYTLSQRRYTPREEALNIATHALGALVCLVFGVLMIVRAAVGIAEGRHGVGALLSVIGFSVALMLMYTMSSVYHASRYGSRARSVLRRFDYCSISVLIAGSYLPYAVIGLIENGTTPADPVWGIVIVSVVLTLAVLTIVFNGISVQKFRVFTFISYVTMGWLIVVRIYHLFLAIGAVAFGLLLGGGLAYTLGLVVYKLRRLPYNHAIWHLFVLAGSVLMISGVYFCML